VSEKIRTEEGKKENLRHRWAVYLDPDLLSGIDSLDLRARVAVEGFISGNHPSKYFGSSHEFVEHREYLPGDDPGLIDWKAFARQERLFIKRYSAVTNAPCQIVLDGSLSMEYSEGGHSKLEYVKTMAAALAYLLFEQKDRLGLSIGGKNFRILSPSRQSSYREIIGLIDSFQPDSGPHIEELLHATAAALDRKGMVMIISDFLMPEDIPRESLQRLTYSGHDILAFQVLHDQELSLDLTGRYRFRDPESGREIVASVPAVRKEYQKRLQQWLREVEQHFLKNKVNFLQLGTRDSLLFCLAEFLEKRRRMR